MSLKKPFERVRRIRRGDVHISSPVEEAGITLCGLPRGTSIPIVTTAPVNCVACRTIADYCQSHRALRKPVKVKP